MMNELHQISNPAGWSLLNMGSRGAMSILGHSQNRYEMEIGFALCSRLRGYCCVNVLLQLPSCCCRRLVACRRSCIAIAVLPYLYRRVGHDFGIVFIALSRLSLLPCDSHCNAVSIHFCCCHFSLRDCYWFCQAIIAISLWCCCCVIGVTSDDALEDPWA